MQHGWTSHLSIWDTAGSVEHKVDIFSKPPRVKAEEMSVDPDGSLRATLRSSGA
jgi:hypothetical protein